MVPAVNPPTTSNHVAVIGAGAAGLVAARELRREGHSVVVFERGNHIGGVWAYTPNVEPDPLSIDPTRPVIHSSLYSSLRTIIPQECMGFTDFPFSTRLENGSRDPRRHPGHSEVLAYLRDFVREFKIEEMIRFETEVVRVEQAGENPKKWRVKSRNFGDISDEIYDAVVVCNGHYTEPRHALIPGIDTWPGKQIHSHNYRVPEQVKDQVVVVIGSSVSGVDISRDIANVTKEVHISSRSTKPETYEKLPGYDNLWLHSNIETVREDGSVVFKNGKTVYADTIMHCTGYKYYFPFLDTKGEVTVEDNRVGPLYKHVFPPALSPGLSFIGLPWQVIPFPMFELQSKWVAAVLAGRVSLPSQEEMEDTKMFYLKLEASCIPKRYTHLMAELDSQFVYNNWLADQCDYPRIEKWREQMFYKVFKRIQSQASTYKDDWDDDHLIAEAYEDFVKFPSNYPSSLIEREYTS
ncbi:flavin containing monooxygenase FMO GS-OX-like protein [Arabidopsis thaliana]|uniref:Flavin-containing monooxygenase FMO GS-OX-like 7 n=1 Tax=Arabidopsis thaliana TaxID=3702 RepID=GSXL7_ARATH|nr:flavin containing monooxygenase FMO GS-OX-like protein [Arabidopsis thaliana]Q9SXD9.2 RecName: Full=Flavin-containing monooxygenase FMO GS-OX-like 7; AltName: Full=Flavin-monooxygenase glucosinolate S-oxygenase-like 7 [Arabidopsis thaliana]ANM58707.1 flavin containing monooxygenase FMO GS-OX-like protein [Arabidopsis thaliana]|eukprot:NP_001321123.1 flavin containing monooxygenase FMO GS-OX-like protein [Arabidopsis thaliana]